MPENPVTGAQPNPAAASGGSNKGPVVIGKVDAVQVNAWILRDGHRVDAVKDAPLLEGDQVGTADHSQVSLVFSDRSTFVLKDRGMIALDDFAFDADAKAGHEFILIAKGAFAFVSGDIAKSHPDAARLSPPASLPSAPAGTGGDVGGAGTGDAGNTGDGGVSDGTGNIVATSTTLTVAALNDAPVLSSSGSSLNYTAGGTAVALFPALSVSDLANLTGLHLASVSGVETLQLAATTAGTQAVALGSEAQSGDIVVVDASAATDVVAVDASQRTSALQILTGSGDDNILGGAGADTIQAGAGADTFVLDAAGSVTITDYTAGTDTLSLSANDFGFTDGNSDTLLDASQYAESATTMPASGDTAVDYGGGNSGAGLIAIDTAGGVQLWSTSAMEPATAGNSHLVATLNGVDTSSLDNTSFHLAV